MHRLVAAVIVVFTACGGAVIPARAPDAAPEPIPITQSVQLSPGSARYRATSRWRVEQDFNGQTQATDLVANYFATVRVIPEGAGLRTTLLIDSMTMANAPPAVAAELARARGASYTGVLSPEGELSEFAGSDSTTQLLQQLLTSFREFFPRVPAGGASPGQQWADSADTRSSIGGIAVVTHSLNRYEAAAWDQQFGEPALKIRTNSMYSVDGTGSQGRQQLKLDGTGNRTSDRYLSATGQYLGYVAADSAQFNVQFTSTGVVVPMRQSRVDTLLVIR